MSEPNVVSALAAVMGELPNIGKGGQASQQQGGYSYRGIEQITAHAAPLLAKHGVVFVPQVIECETRDILVNNKPWTDTILTVNYLICGPGGADDVLRATVVGIGRDNADKGANKALTQAFKYALLQVLCIADGKDDGDRYSAEADAAREPAYDPLAGWADRDVAADAHKELSERIRELSGSDRDRVKAACPTWPMNAHDFAQVTLLLGEIAGPGTSQATAVSVGDMPEDAGLTTVNPGPALLDDDPERPF